MVQSHLSCNEDEKNCSIAAVCRLFINRTKNTMKQTTSTRTRWRIDNWTKQTGP